MSVTGISQFPKVTLFPESLLWKEAPAQGKSDNHKLFIDQHSFVVLHFHFYAETSKLPFLSSVEFICMSINFAAEAFLAGKVGFSMLFFYAFFILR